MISLTQSKRTLFLDFDGCIVNTIKAIVDLYDDDFSTYSKYKKVDWCDINTWDFVELNAATPEYINSYFNQKRFFRALEYMSNAEEILCQLSLFFNITIVSSGYSPNLILKEQWIDENLPYAKFIGVNLKQYSDKSCVDMSNGIFIDDSVGNLVTSNANEKYIFGDIYPWNENGKYKRLWNWVDVENELFKKINREDIFCLKK